MIAYSNLLFVHFHKSNKFPDSLYLDQGLHCTTWILCQNPCQTVVESYVSVFSMNNCGQCTKKWVYTDKQDKEQYVTDESELTAVLKK